MRLVPTKSYCAWQLRTADDPILESAAVQLQIELLRSIRTCAMMKVAPANRGLSQLDNVQKFEWGNQGV